jgi:plasmid stabilization system protein ParE
MAFKVVWSAHAQAERKAILKYWVAHNGSSTYSRKLDLRFRSALRIIARNPLVGRPTTVEDVRVKTVGDHLIFYKVEGKTILVAALWDNRQDPERLRITR